MLIRWMPSADAGAAGSFSDVKGHWAEEANNAAVRSGWMAGYPDGTFAPDRRMTGAETVALMNQMLKRGSGGWTVSSWSDVPDGHWAMRDIEEASRSHAFAVGADGSERRIDEEP